MYWLRNLLIEIYPSLRCHKLKDSKYNINIRKLLFFIAKWREYNQITFEKSWYVRIYYYRCTFAKRSSHQFLKLFLVNLICFIAYFRIFSCAFSNELSKIRFEYFEYTCAQTRWHLHLICLRSYTEMCKTCVSTFQLFHCRKMKNRGKNIFSIQQIEYSYHFWFL